MNYEELIETVSEIIDNEKIYKEGLSLVYELDKRNHEKMDEHLFFKANPHDTKFTHRDVIEVSIGGVLIKIYKKNLIKLAY